MPDDHHGPGLCLRPNTNTISWDILARIMWIPFVFAAHQTGPSHDKRKCGCSPHPIHRGDSAGHIPENSGGRTVWTLARTAFMCIVTNYYRNYEKYTCGLDETSRVTAFLHLTPRQITESYHSYESIVWDGNEPFRSPGISISIDVYQERILKWDFHTIIKVAAQITYEAGL